MIGTVPFDVRRRPSGDQPFIDAILSDRPLEPSLSDGYKVQQVIDAAIQSDQHRKWVSIE